MLKEYNSARTSFSSIRFYLLFLFIVLFASGNLSVAGLTDFSSGLYDYAAKRFGWEAPKRLQIMQTTVREMKTLSGANFTANLLKSTTINLEAPFLRKTNDFYNQVPYYSDQEHWGVDDYWATPVEFIASFGGDCEDYAIAKYMTLKELGIPVDRLRITYVRAINIGETHMVLAYYPTPDSDPWILDNLIPEVRPASQRKDLIPVYSFNDDDLWLPNGSTKKGGATTVRLWRGLIEKMAKESKM